MSLFVFFFHIHVSSIIIVINFLVFLNNIWNFSVDDYILTCYSHLNSVNLKLGLSLYLPISVSFPIRLSIFFHRVLLPARLFFFNQTLQNFVQSNSRLYFRTKVPDLILNPFSLLLIWLRVTLLAKLWVLNLKVLLSLLKIFLKLLRGENLVSHKNSFSSPFSCRFSFD